MGGNNEKLFAKMDELLERGELENEWESTGGCDMVEG